MAKYFEITNDNGRLLVDDESSVIQVLASTKTDSISAYMTNSIDSTEGYKPLAPYTAGRGYPIVGNNKSVYGHIDALDKNNTDLKTFAYRVDGDISNPPYVHGTYSSYSVGTETPMVSLNFHTLANKAFNVQAVWLTVLPQKKKLKDSALVVYDENGGITFDSALGYVHHIATKSAKFNIQSQTASFTVKVADITGLGLDTSKLFLSMRSGVPAVAQWESRGSNQYRVGYRSFIPRLRVTNNIIYVDFGIWIPKPYTGRIGLIHRPAYSFSVYYIPNLKPYKV